MFFTVPGPFGLKGWWATGGRGGPAAAVARRLYSVPEALGSVDRSMLPVEGGVIPVVKRRVRRGWGLERLALVWSIR